MLRTPTLTGKIVPTESVKDAVMLGDLVFVFSGKNADFGIGEGDCLEMEKADIIVWAFQRGSLYHGARGRQYHHH